MNAFSHFPMQQAIYAALSSDSILINQVNGIYDRVPPGTAYPYITLGDAQSLSWDSRTTEGMQQIILLEAWAREGGRAALTSIMSRVYELLHGAALSVSGQQLTLLHHIASEVALENDGLTYHGRMRMRALLSTAI